MGMMRTSLMALPSNRAGNGTLIRSQSGCARTNSFADVFPVHCLSFGLRTTSFTLVLTVPDARFHSSIATRSGSFPSYLARRYLKGTSSENGKNEGKPNMTRACPQSSWILIHGNKHVLHFRIHLQRFHAQFASHSTLLESAKWSL